MIIPEHNDSETNSCVLLNRKHDFSKAEGIILDHLGVASESFWDQFVVVSGSSCDRPRIILGSSWDLFGVTAG